jgi:uncharacterized Ntn-hydrolase superfamily protein
MKWPLKIIVLSNFPVLANLSFAQHTFSIVAIDTVTRQIGSAAASFVPGCTRTLLSQVFFISPGVGAIHTQAAFHPQNAFNAQALMAEGKSPQEIVDHLVANDVDSLPQIRQYLIIDLKDGGRVAGYTGSEMPPHSGQFLGSDYAIAGNTLFENVLENMETAFVNAPGKLADRLMAALLAGKAAGGDNRGSKYGLSSLFAALKVAQPEDPDDSLSLDLLVAYNSPYHPEEGDEVWTIDPVDSLQILYNKWTGIPISPRSGPSGYALKQNYPNPFNPSTTIHFSLAQPQRVSLKVVDMSGKTVAWPVREERIPTGQHEVVFQAGGLASGVYVYVLEAGKYRAARKMLLVR